MNLLEKIANINQATVKIGDFCGVVEMCQAILDAMDEIDKKSMEMDYETEWDLANGMQDALSILRRHLEVKKMRDNMTTMVACSKCGRDTIVYSSSVDLYVPFVCDDCKTGLIKKEVIWYTKDKPHGNRNCFLLVSWRSSPNQKMPFVSVAHFEKGTWKNLIGMEIHWGKEMVLCGWAEYPEGAVL